MAPYLQLFGRPQIDTDRGAAPLAFERRHQLLAYLGARRSGATRAEVASLLWPEQPAKLAHANLRKTLFRMQSLPWSAALDSQGTLLRFDVDTDVARFEAALREERIVDAIRLGTGEFLEGFDDLAGEQWSAWLGFERSRLRSAWRRAVLQRLAEPIEMAEALELCDRLLAADPTDETGVQARMEWLARGGRQAAARDAYRGFAERLQKDYGFTPSAELRALRDSLGAQPIVRAPEPSDTASDGFVGRAAEIRQVADRLAEAGCRLLTLAGAGGAGKTRLARRIIQERTGAYEDGAAFIALEAVPDAAALPAALVAQLTLGSSTAEPLAQLQAHLAERHMLLVLDNFEHLVAGAGVLESLLAACPHLQLLVTSRVRLGVAGEWVVPLHGLPCPDPEDVDRFDAFDAVRLFVRSARRADAGFEPTEVDAIVEICRHVDGLPLALELAAAWTRILPCSEIARELRGSPALLRAEDASHPSRHASLESVFEQSWAMLAGAERDALARLSVFRGGFAPEAARHVAGASLAVLAALMDKSLLQRAGARMLLHPVIHQLASLKLEGDARGAIEAAHAHYFAAMLAQMRRPAEFGDRAALDALDADNGNWSEAWRWLSRQGQLAELVHATPTLRAYADHRGRIREAHELVAQACLQHPQPGEPRFLPVVLGALAHFDGKLDRFEPAIEEAQRALAACDAIEDPEPRLRCLNTLGAVAMRSSRFADARGHYERALALAPAVGNPRYSAVILQNLAQIEKREERVPEALAHLLRALEDFRRIGDHASEALCLYQLGSIQCESGDTQHGIDSLRGALALCDAHGLYRTRGYVLTGLADAAFQTGDLAAADTYSADGLELARRDGALGLEAWMLLHRARVALRTGRVDGAREELRAAILIALETGSRITQAGALVCFAELLATMGQPAAAASMLATATADPSVAVQEKPQVDWIRTRWQVDPAAAPLPLPEGLAGLCRRIVDETPVAYGPLLSGFPAG